MLNSAEQYVSQEITKLGGLPEIPEAMTSICHYVNKVYSYTTKAGVTKHFVSKNSRLSRWNPDKGEIHELVLAIFTIALSNKILTYQAFAGMLAHRIGLSDYIEQVITAAEVIALVSKTGLITITRSGSGNYIMIHTDYELDNIPCPDQHEILMHPAPHYSSNYDPEFGSRILGGKQNYHNGDICLSHINRMNQIRFHLNKPFLCKYEEAPTYALDTPEKRDQWDIFIRTSYQKYIEVAQQGNAFYLNHNYDKRGRCYAEGYHINTQGSSFKKAIVQIDPELVTETVED